MAEGGAARVPVQRKKISIRPIPEARKRQVTFMKRKKGLLKKAQELSILCDCEMAVLIFDKHNQCFQFASGDMDATLERFQRSLSDPAVQREHKTNGDVRHRAHHPIRPLRPLQADASTLPQYRTLAKLSEGDEDDDSDELSRSRARSGRRLLLPGVGNGSHATGGSLVPVSSSELGISPVFTPADGVAAAAAASAPAADGRLLSPGGRRRLNDGERPGKLSPRVHSYMTQRLQEWVAHNPGAQRPRALHAKKLCKRRD